MPDNKDDKHNSKGSTEKRWVRLVKSEFIHLPRRKYEVNECLDLLELIAFLSSLANGIENNNFLMKLKGEKVSAYVANNREMQSNIKEILF